MKEEIFVLTGGHIILISQNSKIVLHVFSMIVYAHGCRLYMGVDYIVIGFDMEVQPLVTYNAA